jgi:hypothetical protein
VSIDEPPLPPEPEPVVTPEAEPETPPTVAPEAEASTPATPAARNNAKLLVIALAILAVVLAGVAGVINQRYRDLKNRNDAVERAAAAMGSALLTYDYRNLPKTKALVLKLATGAFEKQYAAAFEGGLDTILTNSKAISSVRDIDVYISDESDKSAAAIVVVDTVVSGTGGDNRRLTSYIRLDLVNTDDGWLVDGVTNLNLGLPSGGTTSTTVANGQNVTTTTR